jgi:broad specificity phosphatase PhoE
MSLVHLVRHGRAAAGWDLDPDPGLDDVGVEQVRRLVEQLGGLAARPVVTSPLRRCRETAAPLAARWQVGAAVDETIREIPSPIGVPMGQRVGWLCDAMNGTWTDLGGRYLAYRDDVLENIVSRSVDTVVVSHFIAINAVIGACLGNDRLVSRSLDNASVTVVETAPSGLTLVEIGREADTLIR